MTDDKFLLFKMHPCATGLSDELVLEISSACQLLRFDSGEVIQRANEPLDSIYLMIQGRIRQSLIDIQGKVIVDRYQSGSGQIGALAAALGEPSPLQVIAEEPTILLRLNYQTALELTKQHDVFRQNLTRMVSEVAHSVLMNNRRKKKPRLIVIFHQSPTTRQLTRRLLQRLKELDESPSVFSDQPNWLPMEDIAHFCLLQDGCYVSEPEIRQRVSGLPNLKPIFFDIDTAIEIAKASNLVESCDEVFWCVTPDHWKESVSRLRAITQRTPNWRQKITIVWLLSGNSCWSPLAPELMSLATRDFKVSFDNPPENRGKQAVDGLERIIHALRGVRIGLALGGGAAKGMAHLGVLKALEENGIVVDMIAGTSAGAMTGILYASGMKPGHSVDCFIKDLTPSWLFRYLPNGGYWYLLSKFRFRLFDPMLRNYLSDSRLEQLPIPVVSVTVDLVRGQPVVREEGDSASAILESINLPVLSSPINRNGMALVDGGMINNVPANVLVSKGCNFVIAVSVTAQIKQEFASNRPNTPTSKMKVASTLQTIMRTYLVQNVNLNAVGEQPADFAIQPNVSEFDITEFTRADEMAAVGEKATLDKMPELLKLLARVDDKLFAAH
jgi:NTE family protein